MAQIIDGKAVAQEIRAQLSEQVAQLKEQGINPGLAVVLVGDNPASKTYVANKEKACIQVGIKSFIYRLPEDTPSEQLEELIDVLNHSEQVNGILIQLPLPKHLDETKLISMIDPAKDVDGFHPVNAGALLTNTPGLYPCTPLGIIKLIESTGVSIEGKHAVVVGRSNIVGKPVALMLLQKNATVTVCHSRTANLAEITREADILVAAVGKAGFIREDMVKEGAIVIDVGTNHVDGKLCGDVDFAAVKDKAGYITPVPGGVGPMTITMLLHNTIETVSK